MKTHEIRDRDGHAVATMTWNNTTERKRAQSTEQERKARVMICDTCQNYTGGRCSLCRSCSGAGVPADRFSHCPVGRW